MWTMIVMAIIIGLAWACGASLVILFGVRVVVALDRIADSLEKTDKQL
jgi:hypothetical protein